MSKINDLTDKIEKLKAELADLEDSLPAHSVRPHQMMKVEALEEEIEKMGEDLKTLKEST
jgi:chromosome segregation ATPase